MKTFCGKRDELKDKAIDYLKKELDICPEYKLDKVTFFDFFSPHDETQLCEITSIEYVSGDYFIRYKGQNSGQEDTTELDELGVDLLCNLADVVQSRLYQQKKKDEQENKILSKCRNVEA